MQRIFKQSTMGLFNQSSQDEQTVCLFILPLPSLLHPSPLLPPSFHLAALLCLVHSTLMVSVCSLRRKKPQHIEKNQDGFALLDHAEEDLFVVVAGVILTTTIDKLMKSNAEILLKQSEL